MQAAAAWMMLLPGHVGGGDCVGHAAEIGPVKQIRVAILAQRNDELRGGRPGHGHEYWLRNRRYRCPRYPK